MPLPKKNKNEDKDKFVARCMSSDVMKKEYPDNSQRVAICMSQATADCGCVESADFYMQMESGYEEEIDENNFYIPTEAEYEDFGEEVEEYDIAAEKPGLWENIRKKKEREGKNYKPAKRGDKDRPDPESWKKAQSDDSTMAIEQIQKMRDQLVEIASKINEMVDAPIEFEDWTKDMISKAEIYVQNIYDFVKYYSPDKYKDDNLLETEAKYEYQDTKTGEVYQYRRKGYYERDGRVLMYMGEAEEYQGRKVTLNKPFRTPDGPKKFSVYVKNDKGNVVKVNFGDPNMEIKKDIPARRKSFRARMRCDNPGPKYKARFWACKSW
jgi:hypothetical protein